MLNRNQIDILRATPLVMREDSEATAAFFYETLFELSPELRSLFTGRHSDQARKFAATLVVAINSLGDWEALAPVVEALARRHLAYGVMPDHYQKVGIALISTLKSLNVTPEELELWGAVYSKLSKHMIETAYM